MIDSAKVIVATVIDLWIQCCIGIFTLAIIYIAYRILEFIEEERIKLIKRQEAADKARANKKRQA